MTRVLAGVTALSLLVLGLAVGLLLGGRDATPAGDSVEAGFARDMSVHHGQAVDMATTILVRTDDPVLASVARDMALTQQAQIGRMQGWLAQWQLPATGSGPRMAWMARAGDGGGDVMAAGNQGGHGRHGGHTPSADGRMPGMASDADLAALRTEPVEQAEVDFLQLMTTHHLAGVEMAAAAEQASEEPDVDLLAESMVRSQQAEIDVMRDLLAARGAAPADGQGA